MPSVLSWHIRSASSEAFRRAIARRQALARRARAALQPSLIAVALISCAEPSSAPRSEFSDSAGVRVVMNAAPGEWVPAFQLPSEPRASIGRTHGPREHQLFGVNGGTVLADGTLVISNGGTGELRFFDPSGHLVRSTGRTGEGPGEFASLALVGRFSGDSLMLSDTRLNRYSVFDATGIFVRSFRAPESLSPAYSTAGVLEDGRLVAMSPPSPDLSRPSGVYRQREQILRIGPDGVSVEALGSFPGSEQSMIQGAASLEVVFGADLYAAARGDQIAVGNSDAYRVRIYNAELTLRYIISQSRLSASVRPGDFERELPPMLRADAPTSPIGTQLRPVVEQMPRHETLPAFGGTCALSCLRFDQVGNLWVQEFRPRWEEGSSWQAFDRNGVLFARLELPPRFSVLDIGPDWVLGRTRDHLDVERVVLYELLRPDEAAANR